MKSKMKIDMTQINELAEEYSNSINNQPTNTLEYLIKINKCCNEEDKLEIRESFYQHLDNNSDLVVNTINIVYGSCNEMIRYLFFKYVTIEDVIEVVADFYHRIKKDIRRNFNTALIGEAIKLGKSAGCIEYLFKIDFIREYGYDIIRDIRRYEIFELFMDIGRTITADFYEDKFLYANHAIKYGIDYKKVIAEYMQENCTGKLCPRGSKVYNNVMRLVIGYELDVGKLMKYAETNNDRRMFTAVNCMVKDFWG